MMLLVLFILFVLLQINEPDATLPYKAVMTISREVAVAFYLILLGSMKQCVVEQNYENRINCNDTF